ncbi:dihydrodipicolinate synthase family protein [Pseudoxanthomonas wuyuanensis]|uniref:4-hydroxy-tetrahydrodipicolinate synthase n=1 Tax=Pseudoxanthomonas wuyuanensis TaxID=1073196 RepID=A0A286D2X0_9GAMM|nr:dihydrodipicolinate synthase family protein [Pseudoxanthomonas wuyuanensis]KAF1723056.1 dihydrodipicolinate synthase family protein [Pseudoxanthomonas wuyuanensis]SOD52979.1 4-hydroxy-tetrahydrodipicolinate synthase [Pseudoxanthomonas wuyuanensis]
MSNASFWRGVLPAITTPFAADGQIDHAFLAEHARTLIDAGCTAIVPLGSLGEAATLSFEDKIAILKTLVKALDGRAPVVPGIAALSTDEAVRLAKAAKEIGCGGLMVLPPYVYSTDWREMGAHVRAVIAATHLPVILYNNPVAYKTDFSPAQIAELASEFANLQAVKESSADVRRFAAIQELVGGRLELLVGMDDAIVEGLAMGAVGWIAGLVNAYPKESVKLFELARDGGYPAAKELYDWFLPLLRLDTVPKFVQLIKLVQEKVGLGSERVRAPRLVLEGDEREAALKVIDRAIAAYPGR